MFAALNEIEDPEIQQTKKQISIKNKKHSKNIKQKNNNQNSSTKEQNIKESTETNKKFTYLDVIRTSLDKEKKDPKLETVALNKEESQVKIINNIPATEKKELKTFFEEFCDDCDDADEDEINPYITPEQEINHDDYNVCNKCKNDPCICKWDKAYLDTCYECGKYWNPDGFHLCEPN